MAPRKTPSYETQPCAGRNRYYWVGKADKRSTVMISHWHAKEGAVCLLDYTTSSAIRGERENAQRADASSFTTRKLLVPRNFLGEKLD